MLRLRWLLTALLIPIALGLASGDANAQPSAPGDGVGKLDAHLRQLLRSRGDRTAERVIVRVDPGATRAAESFMRRRGDRLLRFHPGISAFTVEARYLQALAELGIIRSISVDAPITAHQNPATPTTMDVVRRTIGVGSAWTGAGYGVAGVDSGIEPSADFGGRITSFYDFTRGGVAVAPFDDYGHGTHVAGLIGGSGTLSGGAFRGMAPGVRLVGLKVLDSSGSGRTSDVIAALEFATANRAALGVDVINLSLGHPPYESAATDPLVQAVESAARAGIVVVVSAGNYGRNPETGLVGYAGTTSPGNAPSALTVGSFATADTVSRQDDRINGFSSRGPAYHDGFAKPDIVAPGYRLIANGAKQGSLYRDNPSLVIAGTSGPDYLTLSGTSMSAAVASGVVVQVLEANRSRNPARALTPNAVKAILQHTASRLKDDAGVEYDHLTQGAGALNAAGAVTLARGIRNDVLAGLPWLDPLLAPNPGVTTVEGETYLWGKTVIWGNSLAWGATIDTSRSAWTDTVVWGNLDTVIWGNTVIWGANVVWDDTVIWGTTVVWGNSVLEGNTVVWGNNDLSGGAAANTVLWGNTLVEPDR